MRTDELVHSHPGFYEWKLRALRALKQSAYRCLFIDAKVQALRTSIQERNRGLIVKHVAGKRVLGVGCGRGNFIASLAGNGNECVGIDVSPGMIETARAVNPSPTYYVMDGAHMDFPDKSFDVVVFNYVLHHVRDLDATIAEAKRVGKTIVFYESCACKTWPAKLLSKLWWKATDGGYTYLTLDEWKARFGLPVLDEIEGAGVVRYGMCVLST